MAQIVYKQCVGEGQGYCKRCMDNGKWNKHWMCFLYEIDGYEGCYCFKCLKAIADNKCQEKEN